MCEGCLFSHHRDAGVEASKRVANNGEFRIIREAFIKNCHCVKKQPPTLPEPSFVDVEGLRSKEEASCAEELKCVRRLLLMCQLPCVPR